MYPAEEVWKVLPREGLKVCERRFRRFFREKKMESAEEGVLPLTPFSSPNTHAEEASSRGRTSSSTSSTKQQQCRLS